MSQMPPVPPPIPAPLIQPLPQRPKGGKGLAIAALVLGICAFIPLLGLLTGLAAVIMAIIVIGKKKRGKGLAIGGICTSGIGMFVGTFILLPILIYTGSSKLESEFRRIDAELSSITEESQHLQCAANMHQIGRALGSYAEAHGTKFPESLNDVADGYGLQDKTLCCPADSGKESGRSYFYHKPQDRCELDVIVLCDLRPYHAGKRGVLFWAGNTKTMTEKEFQAELDKPSNSDFAEAFRAAQR